MYFTQQGGKDKLPENCLPPVKSETREFDRGLLLFLVFPPLLSTTSPGIPCAMFLFHALLCFLFFLPHSLPDYVCGFEDERICGFTQDRSDVFDWTRQNQLSQNPKRSPNTGPDMDRSGTKEGTNFPLFPVCRRPRNPNYFLVPTHPHMDSKA